MQAALHGDQLPRPSTNADLVINLRADPRAARRIVDALRGIGFETTRRDSNGRAHRWERGDAQIDVLQPRYLGDRFEKRLSREGLETIAAPGAQHLLSRTELVTVTLGERSAQARTPTALGIIVGKAAGFQEIIDDPYRVRRLADILTIGPLISARELRAEAPYMRLEKRDGDRSSRLQRRGCSGTTPSASTPASETSHRWSTKISTTIRHEGQRAHCR